MARPSRFSPEVRDRAVRMVLEQQGCAAETLRSWVRQAERDAGQRPGLTTDERARLKALERENFELRRANEILKKRRRFSLRRSSTADPSEQGAGALRR